MICLSMSRSWSARATVDLPDLQTLSGHTAPITALDFTEPYGTLVSASADETVRLWDLTTGDE